MEEHFRGMAEAVGAPSVGVPGLLGGCGLAVGGEVGRCSVMSFFQFSHVSRWCSLCDDGTCAWVLRLIKASPMPPTPCCWFAVWWTVACF